MPVLVQQIPAALLAVFVVGGLWGGAMLCCHVFKYVETTAGTFDSVAWFYVLLLVMCAVLGTRSWFNAPALEWLMLAGLLGGNLYFGLKKFPKVKVRRPLNTVQTWVTGFLVLVLLIDCLYASLPLYRYDQWTYHLVVAKWISQMGTLTPPVSYDPTFFTGNYEFIGLLARAVSSSDSFQQGFQNCLSWLLVAVPAVIMFYINQDKKTSALSAALGFSLFCVFASGDHEALINAKPDYVLMMVALLLIIFMAGGPQRLTPWLAGFLLVGCLSFKITWLHFAACGPIILWAGCGKNWRRCFTFIGGGALALICLLPWALKNWQYFHNPLHPVQSPLFSSLIWSPMYEAYWKSISLKPEGLPAFVQNLFLVVTGLPMRWGMSAAVAVGFLMMLRRHGQPRPSLSRGLLGLLLCLGSYLGVWGIFYGAGIYNRFVSAVFAFPLAVILWSSRWIRLGSLALVILILPFIVNGQLEVSLQRLISASQKPWLDFITSQGDGPIQKIPDLLAIKADRKLLFPNASYTSASLLSDFAFNYYAPSVFWVAPDPATWWQMAESGVDPIKGDGLEFFRKMDIRYVWVLDENRFLAAPPAIQNIIPSLERLPSKLGKLYFVNFSKAEQRR